MSHYFTNEENLKTDLHDFQYEYKGNILKFRSDAGVFSRKYIDYGSQVLLNTITFSLPCKHILDMGCGYGAMGLCLAKYNPNFIVDMVDVNKRAIELAIYNANQNQIQNTQIYTSDLYEKIENTYDVIISNPPIRAGKKVVHTILESAFSYLNDKGTLWVVIQKKQGYASAKQKMESVFENCDVVKKDKGYYVLKSTKNVKK